MNPITAHLQIRQIHLPVNLGWRTKERSEEQNVLLDIDIYFKNPPAACETDHLDNTICYDQLIQTLYRQLSDKHYRLIEHLARDIYEIINASLPKDASAVVHLAKFPKVTGLTGGVCFSYGCSPFETRVLHVPQGDR